MKVFTLAFHVQFTESVGKCRLKGTLDLESIYEVFRCFGFQYMLLLSVSLIAVKVGNSDIFLDKD